ncbi:hypothetical protein BH09BAC3_BH09BAC3_15200 [soil metagenome]
MATTPPKLLLGILIPNIVSLVLIGGSKYAADMMKENTDYSGAFIFSNFFIVPLLVGFISAWYWRDLGMKNWSYVGYSAVNAVIAILFSAIFFKEGIICLLIVSPLILAIILGGAFIGKAIFKRRNNTLNVSFLGILLVVFIGDVFSKHEYTNEVADTMIINAPIEKVWPLVVEYEPIEAKPDYWLFKAGMPSPVQSTVDGHEVGAGRKCIFSNGYVFEEKMVVYKPNEQLTFDILSQPRDPEIMGHIDILRGQFVLKDNGNGTTTIIGTSWYKLYVFPVWYFDAWSESITRNVHLRVMEHIKILSEKSV